MHHFVVNSARDAVRALSAMIPGFANELMTSEARGIRYAVFVAKRNITEKQLEHPSGANDIRIAPILAGSKAGGLFQTILGGVLMVAGAVVGVMTGWTGIGAQIGVSMMMMGAGMVLSGVSQMISRQQQTPQNLQSYNFSGAENVTQQGGPVPLLYGRMRVGSTVISEGLLAQDGTSQLVGDNYVPTTTPPTGS